MCMWFVAAHTARNVAESTVVISTDVHTYCSSHTHTYCQLNANRGNEVAE